MDRFIEASITNDKAPILGTSKGMSEWTQGRFGMLRTGFDKLSPNGSRSLS
jgi:hypothetical protein